MCEGREYMKYLYLPLNCIVNLKLLQASHEKKKERKKDKLKFQSIVVDQEPDTTHLILPKLPFCIIPSF